MKEIIKLKKLVQDIEAISIIDDGTWLDHLNPSQAFLTCIGAGPWKVMRRNLIQKQAVDALGNKDLCEINDINIFSFPLQWQNQKVAALIDHLNHTSSTMCWFVKTLKNIPHPTGILYSVTKTKGRAKVLDLFVRDYLKLPSFPIDRHVERVLKENGFPVNEKYMIDLCKQAELDPSHVARAFVNRSGRFTGNGKI